VGKGEKRGADFARRELERANWSELASIEDYGVQEQREEEVRRERTLFDSSSLTLLRFMIGKEWK
jgi:hypothetical protein